MDEHSTSLLEDSQSVTFDVTYTAKDTILYSLSIGVGSSNPSGPDLHFLYEEHPNFEVNPLFALVLLFWARSDAKLTNSILPDFPSPVMKAMGVIPHSLLKDPVRAQATLSSCPVLHMYQSISWEDSLPVPPRWGETRLKLKGKFHSVNPKSIGTFVTTAMDVITSSGHDEKVLCQLYSTVLIMGLPTEYVIPYNPQRLVSAIPFHIQPSTALILEYEYQVPSNAALLYRLASGDTNRIHVDPASVTFLSQDEDANPQPLLHGLCLLGIVARIIVQKCYLGGTDIDMSHSWKPLRKLSGKFTAAIFMNDTIRLRAWRSISDHSWHYHHHHIFIEVHKMTTNPKSGAVGSGYMMMEISIKANPSSHSRL